MAIYFGFAISDSMFPDADTIQRIQRATVSPGFIKELATRGELIPCLNPSHEATIKAMRFMFGIDIAIPATPPKVQLVPGDQLIVMSVRGLPRLTDRHEYTVEEVDSASFSFNLWVFNG